MSESLPYRPCVGAVIFNREGLVFLGRRSDMGERVVWQCPQGGIDPGEDPATAVMRELREEIGTDQAHILGEHPDWLQYDLPPELLGVAWGGRYRGQTQRWFALRLDAPDSAINLLAHGTPEFDQWRWAPLAELGTLEVGFKKALYARLAVDFSGYVEIARRSGE